MTLVSPLTTVFMDATRLREFLDVDFAIVDIGRKHGLLAEVLERADLKTLKGVWVRRLCAAVDDIYTALDEGESEILRQRVARESAKDEARTKKPKARQKLVRGAANEDLSHDPSTIPGAIRMVLLAVGDPGEDGWVPIVFEGRRDYVKHTAVHRIRPTRPTTATPSQQRARARLIKETGVRVSRQEAKRIRSQWER